MIRSYRQVEGLAFEEDMSYSAFSGLNSGCLAQLEVFPSTLPEHYHLAVSHLKGGTCGYSVKPEWKLKVADWFYRAGGVSPQGLSWDKAPYAPCEENPRRELPRTERQSRGSTEQCFRDEIARQLKAQGCRVDTERNMPNGGRCDIVVWGSNQVPTKIIETKIADPIRGIGQLLLYGSGWPLQPSLVLAIPQHLHDEGLRIACEAGGVELWSL